MTVHIHATIGHRPGAALFPLRVTVSPGEVVLVRGPNGAGKSTLLATIAGLRRPLTGQVVTNGHRASSTRAKRGIGYVTDPPSLFEELTPGEHLELAASLWSAAKVPASGADRSARFVMNVPERAAGLLSLGQRKRLGIAIALLHGPRVWILDEPFNGLDRAGAETLRTEIDAHLDDGGIVLCATHDDAALQRTDATVLDVSTSTTGSGAPS